MYISALAKRPRGNCEFCIQEWGWEPLLFFFGFILFETIGKNTLKLRYGSVLFQKVLGTKSCDGSNKLIVWNNL